MKAMMQQAKTVTIIKMMSQREEPYAVLVGTYEGLNF
jgi:hypothetical protein